jgi:hypothetical protein
MTTLKLSWRRLAALAALGWVAAGVLAYAQNAPTAGGAANRATHLQAETRAGSALAQPASIGNEVLPPGNAAAAPGTAPAAQAPAPAAAPPAAAAVQKAAYQQPQAPSAEPLAPLDRTMNRYDTAHRAYIGEQDVVPLSPDPMGAQAGCGNCTTGCAGGCGSGCASGCGSSCGCNSCGRDCCDPYFYNTGWYVGLDYLLLRPNFSSPAAAVERTTVIDPVTNASVITDRIIEYDIDYESSFRVFGGYRWGECGESIEAAYWQVDADESFTSPPATQTLFFASFEQAIADAPGEVLMTDFDMELNVFDIDYTKRVPIVKGPAGCGECCADWDWAWSIGARVADYERQHANRVITGAGTLLSTASVETSFTGAGPRAGLEGRRYCGDGGVWSFYGTSHLSLLLGDFESQSTRTAGITTTNHSEEFIRTVPVAEIEIGASRQIGCRTLLSVGYQFQAWWEIGRFDTILIGDCECLTSSNVFSLDGLFVRLEHTFGPHCRHRCQPCCN